MARKSDFVRVQLDFGGLPEDARQPTSWFLVRVRSVATIEALIRQIVKKFGLNFNPQKLCLLLGASHIPNFESTRMLQADDIIREEEISNIADSKSNCDCEELLHDASPTADKLLRDRTTVEASKTVDSSGSNPEKNVSCEQDSVITISSEEEDFEQLEKENDLTESVKADENQFGTAVVVEFTEPDGVEENQVNEIGSANGLQMDIAGKTPFVRRKVSERCKLVEQNLSVEEKPESDSDENSPQDFVDCFQQAAEIAEHPCTGIGENEGTTDEIFLSDNQTAECVTERSIGTVCSTSSTSITAEGKFIHISATESCISNAQQPFTWTEASASAPSTSVSSVSLSTSKIEALVSRLKARLSQVPVLHKARDALSVGSSLSHSQAADVDVESNNYVTYAQAVGSRSAEAAIGFSGSPFGNKMQPERSASIPLLWQSVDPNEIAAPFPASFLSSRVVESSTVVGGHAIYSNSVEAEIGAFGNEIQEGSANIAMTTLQPASSHLDEDHKLEFFRYSSVSPYTSHFEPISDAEDDVDSLGYDGYDGNSLPLVNGLAEYEFSPWTNVAPTAGLLHHSYPPFPSHDAVWSQHDCDDSRCLVLPFIQQQGLSIAMSNWPLATVAKSMLDPLLEMISQSKSDYSDDSVDTDASDQSENLSDNNTSDQLSSSFADDDADFSKPSRSAPALKSATGDVELAMTAAAVESDVPIDNNFTKPSGPALAEATEPASEDEPAMMAADECLTEPSSPALVAELASEFEPTMTAAEVEHEVSVDNNFTKHSSSVTVTKPAGNINQPGRDVPAVAAVHLENKDLVALPRRLNTRSTSAACKSKTCPISRSRRKPTTSCVPKRSSRQLPVQKPARKNAADRSRTRRFKCDQCDKQFRYPSGLKIHQGRHSGEKKYHCSECGRSFVWWSSLKVHRHSHEAPLRFACPLCTQTFRTRLELEEHKLAHMRGTPYSCDRCKNEFASRPGLQRHACGPIDVKKIACDVCSEILPDELSLSVHRLCHGRRQGEKKYVCNHCLKEFDKITRLATHERSHTGQRPFVCTTCGRAFCSRDQLTFHVRGHTSFRCYRCSKWFVNEASRAAHECSAVGAFPCPDCDKSYFCQSKLTYHRRIHSGIKPYTCVDCKKSFRLSIDLTRHSHVHSDGKLFVCAKCHKQFTSRDNLQAHRRIHSDRRHSDGRRFICERCGNGFYQLVHLTKHKLSCGGIKKSVANLRSSKKHQRRG